MKPSQEEGTGSKKTCGEWFFKQSSMNKTVASLHRSIASYIWDLWRHVSFFKHINKIQTNKFHAVASLLVGENGHAFFNCDLHGVLKFSQVVGVVPWYLPPRFGRGAEVSPRWNLWGVAFPPGITNIFTKSHLWQFLMDSKVLYICGSAMTYTILQK